MTAQPLNPHTQSSASISFYLQMLPRFNLSIWTLTASRCSSRPILSASSIFLDASIEHLFLVPGLDHPTAVQLVRELNRLAGWDDEIAAWQARRLANHRLAAQAGDTPPISESVALTTTRVLL